MTQEIPTPATGAGLPPHPEPSRLTYWHQPKGFHMRDAHDVRALGETTRLYDTLNITSILPEVGIPAAVATLLSGEPIMGLVVAGGMTVFKGARVFLDIRASEYERVGGKAFLKAEKATTYEFEDLGMRMLLGVYAGEKNFSYGRGKELYPHSNFLRIQLPNLQADAVSPEQALQQQRAIRDYYTYVLRKAEELSGEHSHHSAVVIDIGDETLPQEILGQDRMVRVGSEIYGRENADIQARTGYMMSRDDFKELVNMPSNDLALFERLGALLYDEIGVKRRKTHTAETLQALLQDAKDSHLSDESREHLKAAVGRIFRAEFDSLLTGLPYEYDHLSGNRVPINYYAQVRTIHGEQHIVEVKQGRTVTTRTLAKLPEDPKQALEHPTALILSHAMLQLLEHPERLVAEKPKELTYDEVFRQLREAGIEVKMPTDSPVEYKGLSKTRKRHLLGQRARNAVLSTALASAVATGVAFAASPGVGKVVGDLGVKVGTLFGNESGSSFQVGFPEGVPQNNAEWIAESHGLSADGYYILYTSSQIENGQIVINKSNPTSIAFQAFPDLGNFDQPYVLVNGQIQVDVSGNAHFRLPIQPNRSVYALQFVDPHTQMPLKGITYKAVQFDDKTIEITITGGVPGASMVGVQEILVNAAPTDGETQLPWVHAVGPMQSIDVSKLTPQTQELLQQAQQYADQHPNDAYAFLEYLQQQIDSGTYSINPEGGNVLNSSHGSAVEILNIIAQLKAMDCEPANIEFAYLSGTHPGMPYVNLAGGFVVGTHTNGSSQNAVLGSLNSHLFTISNTGEVWDATPRNLSSDLATQTYEQALQSFSSGDAYGQWDNAIVQADNEAQLLAKAELVGELLLLTAAAGGMGLAAGNVRKRFLEHAQSRETAIEKILAQRFTKQQLAIAAKVFSYMSYGSDFREGVNFYPEKLDDFTITEHDLEGYGMSTILNSQASVMMRFANRGRYGREMRQLAREHVLFTLPDGSQRHLSGDEARELSQIARSVLAFYKLV